MGGTERISETEQIRGHLTHKQGKGKKNTRASENKNVRSLTTTKDTMLGVREVEKYFGTLLKPHDVMLILLRSERI